MSFRFKNTTLKFCIYLIVCLLNFIIIMEATGQESKDISELIKQNSAAKSTQTSSDDLEPLIKIRDYYSDKRLFDSVRVYDDSISKLALATNEINLHIKHYILTLGSDNTLGKNVDNFNQKVDYLKQFLQYDNVSHETKANIYSRIAIKELYNSQTLEALKNSELAVIHADSSEIIDSKFHLRIRLANFQIKRSKYLDAIETCLDAEKLAVFLPNKEFGLYRVNRKLGSIFHGIDDLEKSIEYFLKALAIAKEQNYKSFRTSVEYDLGILYFDKGDLESAEKYATRAKEGIKASKIKSLEAEVNNLFLKIAIVQKQFKKGKKYRDTLYQLLDGVEMTSNRVPLYFSIADFDYTSGKIDDLKKSIAKIESLNSSMGDKNDMLLSLIKYKLSIAESNADQALYYHKEYVKKKDILSERNKDLLVQRIEAENYREKQKVEISGLNQLNIAQDKALSIRNVAIILGSIMLLILCLLLFGLYNLYRKNRLQTIQIQKALADNKLLIKEIHHRVKNNLQVVSSLLNMQARKMVDYETKDAFNTSKMRVQSMSIIHQNLYQGEELISVDTQLYMNQLITNISKTYALNDNIKVVVEVDKINMDVDTLVPLGLIANELICNALKYAFPNHTKGELLIRLFEDKQIITLQVKDNGVGLGGNSIPKKPSSLGSRLIESFVDRLEGTLTISGEDGTDILITFPIDV